MKRVLPFAFAALAAALLSAAPASAQTLKIGFLNSQRVISEAPAAQAAQRTLEGEMTRYKAQVDSMGTALQTAQADLQRQASTMTEAVRTQRQTELQQRFAAYQQQVAQIEQTAQRRQAELVDPVMKAINDVVEQVRREGNWSLILDAATGVMVAADPSLDLTQTVIDRLKAGAAPASR
jgi:outer membrane protein